MSERRSEWQQTLTWVVIMLAYVFVAAVLVLKVAGG